MMPMDSDRPVGRFDPHKLHCTNLLLHDEHIRGFSGSWVHLFVWLPYYRPLRGDGQE